MSGHNSSCTSSIIASSAIVLSQRACTTATVSVTSFSVVPISTVFTAVELLIASSATLSSSALFASPATFLAFALLSRLRILEGHWRNGA